MELELETVTFKRGDNWEERYKHLNGSKHNQLRITRIIKSLGELGWKHLQKPWLEFMIREATINQVLPELNNKTTMDHFIRALKAKEDKEETNKLLAKLNDLQHKNTTEVDKNDGKVAAKSSYKDFKDDEGSEDNSVNDNEVTEGNENHEGVVGDEKSDQEVYAMQKNIDFFNISASSIRENYEYRLNENLHFYRNELCSKPFPGAKIDDMLKWKGDYLKLETQNYFIKWLFPIPESRGMNYSTQPLQEHEAQAISEDESLRNKVLEAFKMMLDFYGMELELEPLTFKRGYNWKERYEHLNRSIHNYFRITRIIKALGELGWQHLQKPWLEFMIHEATINQALPKLNNSSTVCHFIDGLKDVEDQGMIYHLIADLNDLLHKNNADVSKNDG